jgi:hypothetical protein
MTFHKVDCDLSTPRKWCSPKPTSEVHIKKNKWKCLRNCNNSQFSPQNYMCHLIKQLMTFHFGGHWFINPLEVMFTSDVGFGEHHFLRRWLRWTSLPQPLASVNITSSGFGEHHFLSRWPRWTSLPSNTSNKSSFIVSQYI